MNPPPSISVLIRTAGRDMVFLRRALASVREQTLPVAEVIVLNAGEASATVEQAVGAANFTAGVPRVLRHPGLGPAAAANRALEAASRDWVTFLDDDDTWERNFIERVTPLLERESASADFGGAVTQTLAVHERLRGDELRVERRERFNPELVAVDVAALTVENQFTNNALVFRRSATATVGGFREDLVALYDWEFNVRLAARFRLEVVPEMLARYHLRPADGAAPNTARALMSRATTEIRNEWLRADLAAGRIGFGQLALAGEASGLRRTLARFERCRSRIGRWFRWSQ